MFEQRPLSTLIERQIGGGTPPRSNPAFWNGPIPWASVKDFEDASLTLSSTAERISQSGLDASTANLIPAGTPLVCTRMAVGRCAITTQPVAINQDVRALTPKTEVQPRYLLRLLDFLRPAAESQAVGSTVKGIRTSDYLAIKVPVAPVIEQPAIARILDTLDTQIEKTQALIAKLEQVKEGLLHDLLTRGVDENGELRPSAEDAPELYKASALGLIPREWDVRPIAAMAERVTNGFVGVATPHYVPPGRGIAYLYGNNVRANRIEIENVLHVSRSFHQTQSKSQLRQGDMLTVQSGHIGTTAVFDGSLGEANCHALIITRFKSRGIEPRFVALYLNSRHGMRRQSSLFVGSTILHINTSDLAKLHVPVPSIDEQMLCVRRAESIQTHIDAENGMLRKLLSHKSGLMDDLLTGRVRVTPLLDPQETPATV